MSLEGYHKGMNINKWRSLGAILQTACHRMITFKQKREISSMVIERKGKEMDLDSFCITTVRMERVLYRWLVFSMPSKP